MTIMDLDRWIRYLAIMDGRDKLSKIFQYTSKLLLWALVTHRSRRALPSTYNQGAQRRLEALINTLSAARKVMRIAKWFAEVQCLQKREYIEKGNPIHTALNFTNSVSAVANDVIDDIIWASKSKVIDPTLAKKLDYTSDLCWAYSLTIDLYFAWRSKREKEKARNQAKMELTNSSKEEGSNGTDNDALVTAETKVYEANLSFWKLLGDAGVAYPSVLDLDVSGGVTAASGLLSASLGGFKIWRKL